jgi:hypothetical protein
LRYLLKQTNASVLGFAVAQEVNGATFADYWLRPEIQLPLHGAFGIGAPETTTPASRQVIVRRQRRYALHPSFCTPAGLESPRVEAIVTLLDALDNYRRHPPDLSG